MNWRAMRAIIRKDLKVALQNKGVLLPLLIVPVIMFVALPAGLAFLPALGQGDMQDLTMLLEQMPPPLKANLAAYEPQQQIVIMILVYLLAPMFLIVPVMVSSVIAADSFAGEKERKTLEALLYTPTTDRELLVGKLLAAWLPALAVTLGGFVLYAVVANAAAWPLIGRVFFPPLMWFVLVLWVAPAAAGLGLLLTVLVSARAQSFQDAYQIGALVVLPLLLLVVGQGTGVMYFSTALVFGLGLLFWLIDGLLLWFGSRTFQRTELFARL